MFAGPWVGEFGWELMNWQGLLRKLSRYYDEVIVSCRRGNEALYEDFCSRFAFHRIHGNSNCHLVSGMSDYREVERIIESIPPGADHLPPLKYVPSRDQEFIRYGKRGEARQTDVLVHARGKAGVAHRNWDVERWNELLKQLDAAGLRTGCIGLKKDTLELKGVADFRGMSLSDTLDLMASTRLIVGPSSGPMHLAALCGTPHLVWTDRRSYTMRKTSREKYEHWWNPLGTKVTVIDDEGFDPAVERIAAEVKALAGSMS